MQKALRKTYEKAFNNMNSGRFGKAAKEFDKCLAHDMHPDERISVLISYAIAVMDSTSDKAMKLVNDAIALNEKEQLRFSEAQASAYIAGINLRHIVQRQDKEGYLYFLRGHINALKRNYTSAIADYDTAEKAGYKRHELYKKRAGVLFLIEEYAKARDDYSRAICLQDDGKLYHGRGMCSLNLGELTDAEEDLEASIARCDADDINLLSRTALVQIKPYNMVVEALVEDGWEFDDGILRNAIDVKIQIFPENYLVTIIAPQDQDIVDKVKTDNAIMVGLSHTEKTHYQYVVTPSDTGNLEQDIENRGIALIELIDKAVAHFTEKIKNTKQN